MPKLIDQPTWFQSSRDIKICDVVLLIKKDGSLVNTYQFGMIHQNKAKMISFGRFSSNNESVDRFTTRAVCELVLIHLIDELHLMEELGKIASTNGVAINVNKQK